MLPASRILLGVLLGAAVLGLAGCPSLGPNAPLPASVDRAQSLESAGDNAGAAAVYEQLAAQNQGAVRDDFLLRAARDYLAAHRTDDAARVLALPQGALSPQQSTERSLLIVELALDRGQLREASRQFAAIPVQGSGPLSAQYRDLKARIEAATPPPPGPPPTARVAHIALLLPISGRTSTAAISVRDGFMTAYYETPLSERPRVRVYDTGTQSVAAALTQANEQGAEFIVGPLTREEVGAAADSSSPHAPLLALNFLSTDRPPPAQFYQYALSPEDEARRVARRILTDQHRRGVALVPAGDWGTRVLAAFKQELDAGGGELIATATIEAGRTDYSAPITEVLRLSDSTARYRRLEATIGSKLQFEPRRRNDIEFIFSPAQASTERLLRPQLRFHYAGDIPTYATSDAFEPDVRANEELDGLIFPDMPWMLGGDFAEAVRAAAREAWPSGGPHRGRLYAFGFDAFRLAQVLKRAGTARNVSLDGLTGHLTLDDERRVQRETGWAQLHNGELVMLPAVAQH